MLAYVLRRLAVAVLVLLVASILVFVLVANSGDPLAELRANPHVSPATIAAREHLLHLDLPVINRYWFWLSHFVRGDMGKTIAGNSVSSMLWTRLGVTLRLIIPATLLALVFGIGVGVVSARRQYSVVDYSATFASFLFFATPTFVVGILLKQFLAIDFNKAVGNTVLFTLGQQSAILPPDFYHRLIDYVGHTILPVVTLMLVSYAAWSRYQRAEMLEVANRDYIRLARAKGISPRRVLIRHILRNALIPLATVVALDTAFIFGGAVITETVFGWEGMGRFFLDGVTGLDVDIVLAFVMVTAVIVVLANLMVDVLYGYLDPRIRYG